MRSEAVSVNGQTDATLILTLTETGSATPSTEKISWNFERRNSERVTVNEVFDSYIKQKYDLKPTTRTNYVYTYDHYVRETFGKRRLRQPEFSERSRRVMYGLRPSVSRSRYLSRKHS